MWPTIFEFSWDTGHMIFFGVFYAVVIVIATSLVYAIARSIVDMFNGIEEIHEARTEESSRPKAEVHEAHADKVSVS